MNDSASAIDRAQRDREVVQRTAELLTSNLSIEELFHAVCSLLARFVDASTVFIALKDAQGARVAFMLENGIAGKLENRTVRPGSRTEHVLRTGECVLKQRESDWVEGRVAINLPDLPQRDDRVSAIFVPLKFGAEVIGVLSVQSKTPEAYTAADVSLLQTCALYLSVRIHQAQIETQSARLENIAATDSLTGVANRRSFNSRLSAEWLRAGRREPMALILIDVDFFKPFNDTYGHVAGDAALQQVANALSSCLSRPSDLFARYGGEEFVALLPDTRLDGAFAIGERMRQAVYDLGIAHSGSLLGRLTISAGIACKRVTRDAPPGSLIETADAALYEAKRSGRNRVAGEHFRSDAPPAYPSRAYRSNLPAVRSASAGRATHVRRIRTLLRTSPLVCVTGQPGIGKSEQAIEAARREIGRFSDGTFYVDCAALSVPRYLPLRIASAVLGPDAVSSAQRPTLECLHGKRALLLLDNCEDVAAPLRELLEPLLAQSPHLRVLFTSREPLLVPGEVAYTLPPLGFEDAVQLFCERARAVRGGEDVPREIAEQICRQLGGIPRALLLAAAQLRTLNPAMLAARMPERMDSGRDRGRDLVEWAYTILTQKEQRLLRALSVFSVGARADAIAAVNGSTDGLESLVEASLVSSERSNPDLRYLLPNAIRAFVGERAKSMGEAREFAISHARHYRERARALEAAHATREWRTALESMLPELDNIRAALLYTVTQGNDVQLGVEMTCDLINYWDNIGRSAAGREWIEGLLARPDAAHFAPHVRARLLYGISRLDTARTRRGLEVALESAKLYGELRDDHGRAASLFEAAACCLVGGDYEAADAHLNESLELAQNAGDMRRTADVLNCKGLAEHWRGRREEGRELLELSLALFRELEDDRGVASLLGNLGDFAAMEGDFDRAISLTRQSLAILERLHDAQSTGWQLMNLGFFELKRGNTEAARSALRRALELVREYQDDWLSANCVDGVARLAALEGNWDSALQLCGFADAIFEKIGVPRQPHDQREYEELARNGAMSLGAQEARALMNESRNWAWPDALPLVLRV